MMTKSRRHLLPEWELQSAVLLSWPHAGTDWAYMLDEVTSCYIRVAEAISKCARLVIVSPEAKIVHDALNGVVDRSKYRVIEMPTNDTWARDFGMITVHDSSKGFCFMDYKFNGWGLKFAANHDNLITLNLLKSDDIHFDGEYVNRLGFVLEGGSIDADYEDVLMTTSECLLSPNRNGQMTRKQIEKQLKDDLGSRKVIWLESGYLAGDDTDSHVDTLARFLPGKIIAYTSCDRPEDEHYKELKRMEHELKHVTDGNGNVYNLIDLPIPMPIYDEDGQRLPATYANFLIINKHILVPTYGDEVYDTMALSRLRDALPGFKVVGIDCRALIQQHGSLHCITMQIPESVIQSKKDA